MEREPSPRRLKRQSVVVAAAAVMLGVAVVAFAVLWILKLIESGD